jgi:hypothetical protein
VQDYLCSYSLLSITVGFFLLLISGADQQQPFLIPL